MDNPITAKYKGALEKRNQELYADWKSGKYKVYEIVAKYKISTGRIYQIVREMEALGKV